MNERVVRYVTQSFQRQAQGERTVFYCIRYLEKCLNSLLKKYFKSLLKELFLVFLFLQVTHDRLKAVFD